MIDRVPDLPRDVTSIMGLPRDVSPIMGPSVDVVIVGGGVAGSSLAAVLARGGLEVVVLERQASYTDQVRGEGIHPWGVAEIQRLGFYDALIAAKAHLVQGEVHYRSEIDPEEARASPAWATDVIDGVPGRLNISHPDMCEALAATATAHGAVVIRGVRRVDVTPGARPMVSYRSNGESNQVTARLVVGADGRASVVRRQIGVTLERAKEVHMIAGLLVDGLEVDDRFDVSGWGDRTFNVTFPQGRGRARVYLCSPLSDAKRFAGRSGAETFLRASILEGGPKAESWAEAVPAGPCRTYPADDTWTDRPFVDGVVLIGDAAGHNNPLIGQGLSLAFRDVRDVSEVLLDEPDWSPGIFTDYGRARAERLRRVRSVAQLAATLRTTLGSEGDELRRYVTERVREDPGLRGRFNVYGGPDHVDPEVCTDDFRRRYLGRYA